MRVELVKPRNIAVLCSLLGYSRQCYYQRLKEKEAESFKTDLLLQEVTQIRQRQPRVGCRKLQVMLQGFAHQHSIEAGRDKLFGILRNAGLLIRRRRSKKPQTTWSYHWLRKYPNLVEGFIPNAAGQLWVSDITYICIKEDFGYLSLITDAYSRKIVGYCLSKYLTATGCVKALQMALQSKSGREGLIHHSDRGVQYCCHDYISLLNKELIGISMTQDGNPLHNAIAERVNGILKAELLQTRYDNFNEATECISKAITTYNNERLHSSINMLTPNQAHHLNGDIKRLWKNYYPKRKEVPAEATSL